MPADSDGGPAPAGQPGAHDGMPQARLVTSLERIRGIATQEHRNDLVAAIGQELKHVAQAGAVTVIVAAEVSRGKSLLVNALVARDNLLPVDLDVSTGVYVLVQHGQSAGARVFTQASPEPVPASIDAIADWISVANNPGNARGVSYVEVSLPAPLLSEGVSLIDTPGVGGLDAVHGATTLTALSDADALIFVLDASAPLSRPELNFLVKAAQRIQTVILVMTKTDIFPGWLTILDENRKLLRQFAPRFADQEILRVRSPLFFEAARRRAAGDAAGADRFLERSGIPQLIAHLRENILQRSASIKIANGHRLALSVLWQLDAGYKAQLATLNGDTTPLRALQERQKELTKRKGSTEGWRQAATRDFGDVNTQLNHELQEGVVNFRSKFDAEIATTWHRGQHLSFPAQLEADLRLLQITLQHRLAEALLQCAGQQASRLGLEEFSGAEATLSLPERDRLAVRPVSQGTAQLAIVGGGILSGAIGVVRSLITFNPVYAFSGALGLGSTLQSLRTQRSAAEQSEARRLLQAYAERFQRDCKAAIDSAVRSAADTTIEALQGRIQRSLETLQTQIQGLAKQAAQVKEAQDAKAQLTEKSAAIAKLVAENQAAFRDALSAAPRFAADPGVPAAPAAP
jgi:Dynamin family